MSIGHFLGGIAAVIWDEQDRYLLLRRSAQKDFKSGDWECVTGRVDQGESYTQALHREVMEEINAQVQIEFLIGLTHFYRGPVNPENELLGVIFGCRLLLPGEVTYGIEHSEMRWATTDEALQLLGEDHWLSPVIQHAEQLKKYLPPELRETFQGRGFEV